MRVTASDGGPVGAHGDGDALLVAAVRAGDPDAFETLVLRYQAPLFHYLRGFVGDPEQAGDLLQDTFLRAHQSIAGLADADLLRVWLFRIAHNLACSHLRRRRLVRWIPLLPHHPSPAGHSVVESAHVEAALAQVPAEQRAPLLLHLVAGFSYAEVATLLGLSEGAVRMRISRGRAAFRAAYGPAEDSNAP